MIYYQEPNSILYCGHALDVLRELPDESVDCLITSPPYWGLRTYKTEPIVWGDNHCEHLFGEDIKVAGHHSGETNPGLESSFKDGTDGFDTRIRGNFCLKCNAWRGELGLEPTIELYIEHLILIFNEVKRVLKKTGTCWVNIDDSYASSPPGNKNPGDRYIKWQTGGVKSFKEGEFTRSTIVGNLQAKSLCGIPERFALGMQEHGWVRRNTIIWSKPNPMPESVKDRFTSDFEYLYFFTKSRKYWFEQQFEQMAEDNALIRPSKIGVNPKYQDSGLAPNHMAVQQPNPLGRNKRDVWEITTQPYPEAHFATFPEKLCETPILAGCPSMICKKCGKAREKIYEFETIWRKRPNEHVSYQGETLYGQPNQKKSGAAPIDKGYTDCGCNAGFEPGVVLDPFCGSGKALAVAKRLGRKYIGIDLNPNYCKLSVKTLQSVPLAMPLLVG